MSKQDEKKLGKLIDQIRKLDSWLDFKHSKKMHGEIQALIKKKEYAANEIILKTAFK